MINTSGKPTIASAPQRIQHEVTLGLTLSDARALAGLLHDVEDLTASERAVRAYVDLQVAKGEVEALR